VANRTMDSALALARSCGGIAIPFHAVSESLVDADVVLCCTGAPHFILTQADMAALPLRPTRLQVMVDMSVPRNLDPAIGTMAGVRLFDIDDVAGVSARTRAEREAQTPEAERIVSQEIERFEGWLRSYQAAPTIASLRYKIDALRQVEFDRFMSRFGSDLTTEQQAAIEHLTRAIANKFLHEPTVGLKAQTGAKRDAHASAIRELFGLQVVRRATDASRAARSSKT
ncbi:MAG: hypothetical protein KGR26_07215, partial [Cyanobacteria bacterium REEB65]|nr:hypothetical protein [Cyanobacteria bacterium REEB65]